MQKQSGVSQKDNSAGICPRAHPSSACSYNTSREVKPQGYKKVKANGCTKAVVRARAYKTRELCPRGTWQLLTAVSHGMALSFHSQAWYLNYFGF